MAAPPSTEQLLPDVLPSETGPRLELVRDLALDGPPEGRFDRVVRMAQRVFGVPIASINLIEDGLVTPLATTGDSLEPLPTSVAFCGTTVEQEGLLLVTDAATDPRFSTNPLVTDDPHVRFYAGQPLTSDGRRVGVLCLLDDRPRELSPEESRLLRDLAGWVEQELTLDREAVEAREVQRRLLPEGAPRVEGIDLAARCSPARDVGGDLYDWIGTGDGWQVVLCDVMGKGVPAAVVAAGLRAALRTVSPQDTLDVAFHRVAQALQHDLSSSDTFATLFVARLDPVTGRLSYVDAGHGLAVVVAPGGRLRRLSSTGLPLGIMLEDSWELLHEHLEPEEVLVVVSDGVLDAYRDATAAFDHIGRVATPGAGAAGIVDRLLAHALRNAPPRGYADDVTVMAMRRTSTP